MQNLKNKLKKLGALVKYVWARLLGKDFHMFPNGKNRTAAQAQTGFWYVGDVGASYDIAHGVLINGTAEQDSETLILKFIQEHTKDQPIGFYDIGCNTGYFTLLAAFANSKVTAYGFDPVPEFCETALLSVQLNHLRNCHIFNYAVGSTEGNGEFFFSGTGTSLVPNFGRTDTTKPRPTTIVNLDEFIENNQLVPPNFIMIDVEGFEMEVLRGVYKNLKKHRPYIYYECQPYSPSKNIIELFLRELAYDIAPINEVMFLATPSPLSQSMDNTNSPIIAK